MPESGETPSVPGSLTPKYRVEVIVSGTSKKITPTPSLSPLAVFPVICSQLPARGGPIGGEKSPVMALKGAVEAVFVPSLITPPPRVMVSPTATSGRPPLSER